MTTLTIPQTEMFNSQAKATALVSGFGAGKTMSAITRMLATKFEYPEVNLLYAAPTYSLIRDILYPEISEALEAQGFIEDTDFFISKGDKEIVFPGAGKILCRTMDNPERLVGFQVGDAFLDEFDILPTNKAEAVWNKALARIRKPFPHPDKKNQIFVTTTPEGYKATYKKFQKETHHSYKLIRASTLSNPHLPDDYVDTLRDSYPAQLIDAYINGYFVNLTAGSVYYSYDRKKCDTHYTARPRETLHIGMDFNVYKMAAIVHIVRDNVLYAVDEFVDIQDTPSMIETIQAKYPEHPLVVYPDASGKNKSSKGAGLSDHTLLRDAGFRIRAPKANPLIRDRVASMNVGFEKNTYKVNVKRCPTYVECLEQQVYDKNGMPDKTADIDHAPDAGGYCRSYLMPVNRKKIITRALGGL